MTPSPRDAAATPAVGASGVPAAAQVAFGVLTDVLRREREVLEELLYKLTVQKTVLRGAESRWLTRADAEVRAAVEGLQDFEILRAAEVDLLVRHYGLPANVSLRELAETAPEPWPMVLLDHREALRTLTLEINAVAAHNQRLLQDGERATREALDRITAAGPHSRSFILDEQT